METSDADYAMSIEEIELPEASKLDEGDSDDCFEDEFHKTVQETAEEMTKKRAVAKRQMPKLKRDESDEALSTDIFVCSVCEKSFPTRACAKAHINYHHSSNKYVCSICAKVFKVSSDLERHIKNHLGIKQFACTECDKTFVCKSSLNQHRKLQHLIGSIYKCSVCEKAFCTDSDLKRHLAVHTGEKSFKCTDCGKYFACKSSLNVHRRNHDGKKYTCTMCSMQFYMKCDLDRHMSNHTGNKHWLCRICSKTYSCKSAIKLHIKKAHMSPITCDGCSEDASNEAELKPDNIDLYINYTGKPDDKCKSSSVCVVTIRSEPIENTDETIVLAEFQDNVESFELKQSEGGCL